MSALDDVSDMVLGLVALAAAGDKGWFFGHVGAGLLAVDALTPDYSDQELGPARAEYRARALALVEECGRADWLHQPGSSAADWRTELSKAAGPLFRELRNSGHGIIYMMWAARAFERAPELATADVIRGLQRLFDSALGKDQNRYYAIENHDIEPVDPLPQGASDRDLIAEVISNCVPTLKDSRGEERTFFFTGSKYHVLTFLHAALELDRLGFSDFAGRAKQLWNRHRVFYARMVENAQGQSFKDWDRLSAPENFFGQVYNDPHAYKYLAAGKDLLRRYDGDRKALEEPFGKSLSTFS